MEELVAQRGCTPTGQQRQQGSYGAFCEHCPKRTRAEKSSPGQPYLPGPLNRRASTNRTRHGGSLEIFRLKEYNRGSLLVSVSQTLRADQHLLRVSNCSAARDETKQFTTTLFVVNHHPRDHQHHYLCAGLSIPGAAQALDRLCEALWPPGRQTRDSQCCGELWR